MEPIENLIKATAKKLVEETNVNTTTLPLPGGYQFRQYGADGSNLFCIHSPEGEMMPGAWWRHDAEALSAAMNTPALGGEPQQIVRELFEIPWDKLDIEALRRFVAGIRDRLAATPAPLPETPYHKHRDTASKTALAQKMHAEGYSLRQIMRACGWTSPRSAQTAVKRAAGAPTGNKKE